MCCLTQESMPPAKRQKMSHQVRKNCILWGVFCTSHTITQSNPLTQEDHQDEEAEYMPIQKGETFLFYFSNDPTLEGCMTEPSYLENAVPPFGDDPVFVYKIVELSLVPWVIVAKSAGLLKLKKPIDGWGVYAWHHFKKDQRFGVYFGKDMGAVGDPIVDKMIEDLPEQHPYDKILKLSGRYIDAHRAPWSNDYQTRWDNAPIGGYLWSFATCSFPGMWAGLVNDARGGCGEVNAYVCEPHGVMCAKVDIDTIFDPNLTFEQNAESELFWDYGMSFQM